jgi:translation initiation factor IF-3
VVSLREALNVAASRNLDLVEVAADARPPVCRIMDYGKWRYEQEQKAKQARKHQSTITIKEIKFRPKIDPHDYATKKGHVVRFLKNRDKVKVTIMFRGRELIHPERGEAILLRLADEVKDLALVESRPNLDGRNMVMMLAPHRQPQPGSPRDSADESGEPPPEPQPAATSPATP